MGRWLKKLEVRPKAALTELTQPPSVGFVSSISRDIQKNNTKKIDLFDFVLRCCVNFQIESQEVIDRLLSIEDEQDIINGDIPADSLRLHVQVWIEMGKPHYSGKELG